MTVVALGHCGPRPRDESDPRHRVLYLPDAHLIVTVEGRTHNGWRCTVIAGHGHDHRPGHVTLTGDEFTHAYTTVVADPVGDPDLYALLWQARVRQRWLGGHIRAVARSSPNTCARPAPSPSSSTRPPPPASSRPPTCVWRDVGPRSAWP